MGRIIHILLLMLVSALGITVWAQQKAGGRHERLLVPRMYLGATYSGGTISKNEFNSLLKKGFSAQDSLGNKYRIIGFDFTYAERSLYEDSVGNLEVLVDFMSEYCPGDTVTASIAQSVCQRIKAGDTVFIDHVQLQPYPGNKLFSVADTFAIAGKGMKCPIAK